MKDVLGIVDVTRGEGELEMLTARRSMGALPFGGRYRLIDFVLSKMVNAGIDTVGVFTESNCHPLMDHLRYAKDWDLHRRWGGLSIFTPDAQNCPGGIHRGNLEKFAPHRGYVENADKDLVVLAETKGVFSGSLERAVSHHRESGADVTVLWSQNNSQEASQVRHEYYKCESQGRVQDILVSDKAPEGYKKGIGVYIINKESFLEFVEGFSAKGYVCLVKDGILKNINTLKVMGYELKGYTNWIDSVTSYYKVSMDILDAKVRKELFYSYGPIHTKVKVEPPSKYYGGGEAYNSLVASGCLIEGKVENSILFRGVRIEQGAHVKNSIVMPKCTVGSNTVIDKAILDKGVSISASKSLKGDEKNPVIVSKNKVV